ncbi:MAG: RidA family protein [Actinomycetota bacterium]|jgi:enamine deaminase RidA (YjgF/YER057c/UK114 family)|nr:RidA family protein [Rubrobacter sp.]MDQ3509171.1 RidA family protein [Actinomycetota bacterium]
MSPSPSERLRSLGVELPKTPSPAGSYVPATRAGNLVFTAGQLPFDGGGELAATGKVGAGVSVEEALKAARLCALNALAAAAEKVGGLDNIGGVVKVVGFVASAEGFDGQPKVVNGASDFIGEIFGEAGIHARSAVGVAELPLNSPVEVEIIATTEAYDGSF